MITAFQKIPEENRGGGDQQIGTGRMKKYSNLKLNTNGYNSGTNSQTNAGIQNQNPALSTKVTLKKKKANN